MGAVTGHMGGTVYKTSVTKWALQADQTPPLPCLEALSLSVCFSAEGAEEGGCKVFHCTLQHCLAFPVVTLMWKAK